MVFISQIIWYVKEILYKDFKILKSIFLVSLLILVQEYIVHRYISTTIHKNVHISNSAAKQLF